jgi:Sulfotransferase family
MEFTFLICSERSGSNLINSIMNAHPQVSGPPPSHLFRLFGLNAHRYQPLKRDENWAAFLTDLMDAQNCMIGEWNSKAERAALDSACPKRTVKQALEYLYACERKDEEQISFVKENYTYLFLPYLLEHWPKCRFVYMVRDPRDVAASWVKTRAMPGGVKRAVEVWLNDQTQTLDAIAAIKPQRRMVQIRYEDLIENTEQTARTLCKHHGLAYDPAMLNFHQDPLTQKNAKRTQAWENLARPVLSDNAGKYAHVLTPDDIRYVELRCADLMHTFHYPLSSDAADLSAAQRDTEAAALENQLSAGAAAAPPSKREQVQREQRQRIIARVLARGLPA